MDDRERQSINQSWVDLGLVYFILWASDFESGEMPVFNAD